MISFFRKSNLIYAVAHRNPLDDSDLNKLNWLLEKPIRINKMSLNGRFIGPPREMVTPWSTNAVEICLNMGINGIIRFEQFKEINSNKPFDKMLEREYSSLDQHLYTININPAEIAYIKDIEAYNNAEGLAFSKEEIDYLENISKALGRNLTDSEVFGFSQVNSEHCRHKIFNGHFIIDGEEKRQSLFQLIKNTSKQNPNYLVSAYSDNVAFIAGPEIEQFAPLRQDRADYFKVKKIESVISLKAETHNFPTTVEPFNGAATGSGGEIRDRMAGGQGSIPLAGTAVYMTSYPRNNEDKKWEHNIKARNWLYQTPTEILIKASNGASDYGNKFGQPLICGSLLTFEHQEKNEIIGYDKVIMLAGGIGFGKRKESQKKTVEKGDAIVLLGGDNYRIGMGGGAVSSVITGEYQNRIELNAVQRSNPEMQKRVANATRAMTERDDNPVISIHDHGAGGHLNCFSELVEQSGGKIYLDKLPIGDPTLSDKEIISNESQERMGVAIKNTDIGYLSDVSNRERAPFYIVGEATGDQAFTMQNKHGQKPIDLKIDHLIGSSPKITLKDDTVNEPYQAVEYSRNKVEDYLKDVLSLESVASKDWLTNKVDRCVTGKVAKQQTCGELQIPLNNVAVTSLDYQSKNGVATSIGHAPVPGLIDAAAGIRLSITEALTNLTWAPLTNGLKGVSLSMNWMWPAKNEGEISRLYKAVEAASNFAINLGINIPTGKDSLSMSQKYPNGSFVKSPGTAIASTVGQVLDITKIIEPVLQKKKQSSIFYVSLNPGCYELGGSAFCQTLNNIGDKAPDIKDANLVLKVFEVVQSLINNSHILAGHDVSSGGLVTALLEMNFPNIDYGLHLDLDVLNEKDFIKLLFSETPAILIQARQPDVVVEAFEKEHITIAEIGHVIEDHKIIIDHDHGSIAFDVDHYRRIWTKSSYLLDQLQTESDHAEQRWLNFDKQSLSFSFPENFTGQMSDYDSKDNDLVPKAAVIREKGVNGDREMAWCLHYAGFEVKDIHMTDLISGRETLNDVHLIVFVGGFSNSDVLGSAKGWAGAFLYNPKANKALKDFYSRHDTLSLGVCNGCQLMMELDLLFPGMAGHPKMGHNKSGKFECSFLTVDILPTPSIMLKSLEGSKPGIWIAHGEGRFILPKELQHKIAIKYDYKEYPGCPNGSDYHAAALVSDDGRHLAIMPHLERSLYPWNWPYYPKSRKKDKVSPWIEPFVNAREWIKSIK